MRKKIIGILLFVVVAVAVTLYSVYNMFYGSAVEKTFTVTLMSDDSYSQKIDRVKEHIDHHFALDFYADRIGLSRSIKAGRYTFDEGATVIEIARKLKFGNSRAVRLTINNARTPEALAGRIARQIDADSVAMLGALRGKALIEEMGFDSSEAMFSIFIPNTYEVYPDIEPEALVRKLKDESDKFWAKHTDRVASLGLTPYEIMTLASIVHEETNAVDEMPRIAGVYLNRLWKGMPLQADPTVKYAVGDPTLKRILFRHLEVDSPYNTYKVVGLPPTPIAMPDMSAIEAVLNYEKHDYLYFCARPEMDGRHNFARTHREHERNAAAYHRALERQNIR